MRERVCDVERSGTAGVRCGRACDGRRALRGEPMTGLEYRSLIGHPEIQDRATVQQMLTFAQINVRWFALTNYSRPWRRDAARLEGLLARPGWR